MIDWSGFNSMVILNQEFLPMAFNQIPLETCGFRVNFVMSCREAHLKSISFDVNSAATILTLDAAIQGEQ